ncbi:SusD/RagB family nutrient-binding outer membrane lipoprotein [Albibacterium indicum]|uniref:SusD/RagB family nutrient-binding outer membrane lipoprotein n=1 Tax=Albibacterium indicum TaxID=2292082 RepID=UPI000E520DF2|nr:SusD/RagB family nutrient-binding outer membrane lipoprotein [Pedobacter indicus]
MKILNNKLSKSFLALGVAAVISSCSKFEDINKSPQAADDQQVQVEYFINASINGAQMNPDVAERAFVLYWKTAGRQHRLTFFNNGTYDDGYTSAYYNQSATWLNRINEAVQIAEAKIEVGDVKEYTGNLLQVARIWRAYLLSEFSDNFGPAPIDAFKAVNPTFASTKDVYYYCLEELKDASSKLDLGIANPEVLKGNDPAYQYDYEKWQKYANSMRLRLAMRLSEVDPAKAKAEFEDAASKPLLTAMDETFQVQEAPGWSDLSGVMSREWNSQLLSPTLNNLFIGLGGVESADQLTNAEMKGKIKAANYMGEKYDNHISSLSNDPSAGYWLDGLPNSIDPRAYKLFIVPGDFTNPDFSRFPTYADNPIITERNLVDADGKLVKKLDGKNTWNAATIGDWGEKGAKNQIYIWEGANPRLAQRYRNSANKRIFFAPWETYFLLAEAGVRGWAAPGAPKSNYEKGIELSFAYNGVSSFLTDYLKSTDFNRVGTSVSWDHTTEPTAKTVTFKNGYTGAAGSATYNYPKNTLYKNGTVNNDHLTKIITQKFIAQTPWLPMETWSDHRRLGLPFFENPAIERPLIDLPALNKSNYMTSQVEFFPQRLRYPSGFRNSDPDGYAEAVSLLEGEDAVLTPLWWAMH